MIVAKAVKMANMMNIPILGLVENMSYVVCPDCGKKIPVFGESHTARDRRRVPPAPSGPDAHRPQAGPGRRQRRHRELAGRRAGPGCLRHCRHAEIRFSWRSPLPPRRRGDFCFLGLPRPPPVLPRPACPACPGAPALPAPTRLPCPAPALLPCLPRPGPACPACPGPACPALFCPMRSCPALPPCLPPALPPCRSRLHPPPKNRPLPSKKFIFFAPGGGLFHKTIYISPISANFFIFFHPRRVKASQRHAAGQMFFTRGQPPPAGHCVNYIKLQKKSF